MTHIHRLGPLVLAGILIAPCVHAQSIEGRQRLLLAGRPLSASTLPELWPAVAQAAPSPSGPHIGPWPYIVFIGGSTADYVTTYRFQSLGRYETNPLIGQNVWVILSAKIASGAFVVWVMRELTNTGHPTAAKIFGYGGGILYTAVAVSNERFYRERVADRK